MRCCGFLDIRRLRLKDTMATTATLTYWGPYLVQRDGNDDLQIHGHPNDPDPSPIGQSLKQSRQCRIARPAIRRSWLRDGPGANVGARGHDPFVEVEWDEALDLVGAELARVRDEHGHASIFAGSYGWGSTGRFHMPSAQLFRFIRQFGGCTDVWGTYSSSGAEAIVPYIFGGRFHGIQRAQTSWSVIAEHTELFVSFGGLRLTNAQVSYNGQGPHQTRGWMQRACARQLEFLNISPLRDDIAAEFQPRWFINIG
jgi:biotin/methionine sulfoxide reductase